MSILDYGIEPSYTDWDAELASRKRKLHWRAKEMFEEMIGHTFGHGRDALGEYVLDYSAICHELDIERARRTEVLTNSIRHGNTMLVQMVSYMLDNPPKDA